LLVRTLAAALQLDFKRVQFTPDLMPGDVTGSLVYDARTAEFEFHSGPVFTNLLLADEINRTPPKTQAALLEAMEEHQVTADGVTRPLPDPFLVAATQNPIEHEGTYPLPEAQVDRFMFKLLVTYPARAEEREVLDRMVALEEPGPERLMEPSRVLTARRLVHSVYADARIKEYVLDLVGATRRPADAGLAELAPLIEFGASPRAAIFLLRAAKAHAFIRGRAYVTPDDIKALGLDVLRHRVILTYRADAEGVGPDALLGRIFEAVPVP
jgi:MoxR-like ATPase